MSANHESLKTFVAGLRSHSLRYALVRPQHAPYIYRLRTDAKYNANLSDPPSSVAAQTLWIENYLGREEEVREIYLMVSRADGVPCGTVRLYHFENDVFSWGSWILDANKTRYAAVETALAVYGIGFEYLGFRRSQFDVRLKNEKVIAFHQRMGATETGRDPENIYMSITKQAVASFNWPLAAGAGRDGTTVLGVRAGIVGEGLPCRTSGPPPSMPPPPERQPAESTNVAFRDEVTSPVASIHPRPR